MDSTFTSRMRKSSQRFDKTKLLRAGQRTDKKLQHHPQDTRFRCRLTSYVIEIHLESQSAIQPPQSQWRILCVDSIRTSYLRLHRKAKLLCSSRSRIQDHNCSGIRRGVRISGKRSSPPVRRTSETCTHTRSAIVGRGAAYYSGGRSVDRFA